ncbi:ribonuclease H-like domain-containing protein [Tanacetum coccineum]
MTHPHLNRRFDPQAILTRSGKINIAGASVNTTVRPVNTAGSKLTVNHPRPISNAYKKGYSQVTKPFNKYSTNKNSIFNKKKVNTGRVKDTTTRDRVVGNPQQKEYREKGVFGSDGKGRISGKGKIKSRTLVFDDVYICKELKYNLFSVSQICDKKNNVLFTDTEYLFLSSDLKLLDESQLLLRVPRKDNIYSVDLKSVVPTKGLTCLFAKATNKLVRGNLVRGLPSKIFENNHSCIACQKGKQHKASCKAKLVNSISKPLHMLHMDLFSSTNVKSLIKKSYCLVVIDDLSRFSWNGVAKRKNRTLIEAARTMLVNSKLPTTFWVKAVNTACYVLNRVLVIKPNSKIPYELIHRRTPLIDFMKPFGCPVTILNTRDHLGKFDGKADEGFFVTYSMVSKVIRVFNKRTRIVKETLNIRFLENAPNVTRNGPDWLFYVDSLSKSMNYVPVVAENQTNEVDESKALDKDGKDEQDSRSDTPVSTAELSSTYDAPSSPINAAKTSQEHLIEQFSPIKNAFTLPDVLNVSPMDDNTRIFAGAYDDEDVGGQADLNNLETTMNVSSIPTTRINKDHTIELIIRDLH